MTLLALVERGKLAALHCERANRLAVFGDVARGGTAVSIWLDTQVPFPIEHAVKLSSATSSFHGRAYTDL